MYKSINDYAVPFSAWELRLYLDTHPDDIRALKMYRQLCSKCAAGSYACVPECYYTDERWKWVDDPWPWENAANCTVKENRQCGCNDNYTNNRFGRRV